MIGSELYVVPLDDNDGSNEELIRDDLQHMNVVFTNGCFDMLHPGHLSVIRRCVKEARKRAGVVVIGVNSDASVGRLKGPHRPLIPAKDRAMLLSALRGVDMVIIFDEDTPERLINILRPKVIVKGGDYTSDQVVTGDSDAEVVIHPLSGKWSTTGMVEYIQSL